MTETTTDAAEPPAGDYEALARAFTSNRGADPVSADDLPQPEADAADEPGADKDTLSWLLAEAHWRLDNPDENTEAARHRVARREAESKAAAVTTRLEAMQRAAIDRQVAAMGMRPAALWASGAKLDELLDDEGVPDVKKVEAAAAAAKDQLGITGPQRPSRGLSSGASAPERRRPDPWVAAFAPQDK